MPFSSDPYSPYSLLLRHSLLPIVVDAYPTRRLVVRAEDAVDTRDATDEARCSLPAASASMETRDGRPRALNPDSPTSYCLRSVTATKVK